MVRTAATNALGPPDRDPPTKTALLSPALNRETLVPSMERAPLSSRSLRSQQAAARRRDSTACRPACCPARAPQRPTTTNAASTRTHASRGSATVGTSESTRQRPRGRGRSMSEWRSNHRSTTARGWIDRSRPTSRATRRPRAPARVRRRLRSSAPGWQGRRPHFHLPAAHTLVGAGAAAAWLGAALRTSNSNRVTGIGAVGWGAVTHQEPEA